MRGIFSILFFTVDFRLPAKFSRTKRFDRIPLDGIHEPFTPRNQMAHHAPAVFLNSSNDIHPVTLHSPELYLSKYHPTDSLKSK